MIQETSSYKQQLILQYPAETKVDIFGMGTVFEHVLYNPRSLKCISVDFPERKHASLVTAHDMTWSSHFTRVFEPGYLRCQCTHFT